MHKLNYLYRTYVFRFTINSYGKNTTQFHQTNIIFEREGLDHLSLGLFPFENSKNETNFNHIWLYVQQKYCVERAAVFLNKNNIMCCAIKCVRWVEHKEKL